jgi:succinate dehydrogenase/fumarate reductase flavoprotein subunit
LCAQVTGYDRGLRLLHAGFASIYEAYLPGWLVLVDRQGRRFCDETAPYGIMDGLIQEQGDVAYVIFDRATLDDATAAGVARYKQKVPGSTKKQSPHWNTDIVESMVAAGKVHQAWSVAELAAGLGLPAGHLEATVERYNAAAAAGEGFDYLKDPKFLEPIATPPFYAAEIRPATVCFTACGLRIDRDAQVIGESGRPIPGLFAAGERRRGGGTALRRERQLLRQLRDLRPGGRRGGGAPGHGRVMTGRHRTERRHPCQMSPRP